jgi:hypothetical protein
LQEQVGNPAADRLGTERLQQHGHPRELERQALDQVVGKARNPHRQFLEIPPLDLLGDDVGRGLRRPDVRAPLLENVRTADQRAFRPVRDRDLLARGREVVRSHDAALDQVRPGVRLALRKKVRAAAELLARAPGEKRPALRGLEFGEKIEVTARSAQAALLRGPASGESHTHPSNTAVDPNAR